MEQQPIAEKGEALEADDQTQLEPLARLDLLQKILSQDAIQRKTEPDMGGEFDINVGAIRQIAETYVNDLRNEREQDAKFEAAIPALEGEAVAKRSKAILDSFPEILQSVNPSSPDLGKALNISSTVDIDFTARRKHARYVNPKTFGEDSSPRIEIGGEHIRREAGRLKAMADKLGTELSADEAVDVALTSIIAHEYGHFLEDSYKSSFGAIESSQLFQRSETVLDSHIPLNDETDRETVFSERFAQSIGAVILEKTLADQGRNSDFNDAATRLFFGRQSLRLQQYQNMISWGNEHGVSTSDVSGMLLEASIKLGEEGEEDLSNLLKFNWRSAGYYMRPFNRDQLEKIL